MFHLGSITSGSRQRSHWVSCKRLHKACTLGRSRGAGQGNVHVLIPSSLIVDVDVWCGPGRSGSGVFEESAEGSDQSFLLSQLSSSKSLLRAQVAVCPHSQDESDLRRASGASICKSDGGLQRVPGGRGRSEVRRSAHMMRGGKKGGKGKRTALCVHGNYNVFALSPRVDAPAIGGEMASEGPPGGRKGRGRTMRRAMLFAV